MMTSAPAVLSTNETSMATVAPQPKANTKRGTGSFSYRSSHRNAPSTTGNGNTANTAPTRVPVNPTSNPVISKATNPERKNSTAKNAQTKGCRTRRRG